LDIIFRNDKLRRLCCDSGALKKSWGERRARLIRQRLDELRAAPNLEEMSNLPGRCHELGGTRKGQMAVNLDGGFRLILEPADEPIPLKPDGGIDRSKVRKVRILEVTDYHD
jgi:proteic killer suppression protein